MNIDKSLEVINRREADIKAWAHHDALQVRESTQALQTNNLGGSLVGMPIGVKDIFDTVDMPTHYGSRAYPANQPSRDAWVVSRLKAAGAVIMGKTVTTEFAHTYAGPTRNPHDLAHSPGGSSSGSAAAVASGMVPVALGSQTGGSVIRPSAYCGIIGFKPTYGLVSLQGVMPLAPSLDTLGIHARTIDLVRQVFSVLAVQIASVRKDPSVDATPAPIRIGWYPGPHASQAEQQALEVLSNAAQKFQGSGAIVKPLPFEHEHYVRLAQANRLVMIYEAAQMHHGIYKRAGDLLGPSTAALIREGLTIQPEAYESALLNTAIAKQAFEASMADIDVVLTLSAPGEAPLFEAGTGSSMFNQAWTSLGVPCLTLPAGRGAKGLPIGIQLVAARNHDLALLAHAERLSESLTSN